MEDQIKEAIDELCALCDQYRLDVEQLVDQPLSVIVQLLRDGEVVNVGAAASVSYWIGLVQGAAAQAGMTEREYVDMMGLSLEPAPKPQKRTARGRR